MFRIISVLILALMLACAPVLPASNRTIERNITTEAPVAVNISNSSLESSEVDKNESIDSALPRKEVVEGELVNFPNLKAIDPDGDPITYSFTKPLNEKGEWRTKEGDAGQYQVTITASDGVNTVTQQLLIVVKPRNRLPEIMLEEPVEVAEGQNLTLKFNTTDADGDNVSVTYSGYMTSPTKFVDYNESGPHKVVLTATDGKAEVKQEVLVTVKNTNRAPVLSNIDSIVVKEGEKVSLKPSAKDPDGDKISYIFDEPLNDDGMWETQIGDAGEYEFIITATDGELTAEQLVQLTVESVNRPPVIELEPVKVKEGETVLLKPVITDKENDEVKITYSGWMTGESKQTGFDDQGEHKVIITARDSAGNQASLEVTVTVEDVNRPPVFGTDAFG